MSSTIEAVASGLVVVAIPLVLFVVSRRARQRERDWLMSQPALFREERVPLVLPSWWVSPRAWRVADVHVLDDWVYLRWRSVLGIHGRSIWIRRSARPIRRPIGLLSSPRAVWLDSVVRDGSSLVLKVRTVYGPTTTSIPLAPRDLAALVAALETTPSTGAVADDPYAAADAAMRAALDRASGRRASSRES